MKIKELIEKLNKFDKEKEVIIKFCLEPEDEIGYVLEPIIVSEVMNNIGIYAEYTATAEDCAFIGQVDLKEAYKKALEED